MKPTKKTIITTMVCALALCCFGFYTWSSFWELALPAVGNVKYTTDSFSGPFKSALLFGLSLGLIPVASILIWSFGHVSKIKWKILTVCILILTMTIAVCIRREMVKPNFRDVASSAPDLYNSVWLQIPMSSLMFEIFALAGLLVGSVIAFLLLRKKQNK